jgi:hypothetical protein
VKEEVSGAPVDASGELPGDIHFKDGVELRAILKADPELDVCITQHLLTYGLGRGPTGADACTLEDITQKAEVRGGRLADLLLAITQSEAFTHRRGEAEGSDMEGTR